MPGKDGDSGLWEEKEAQRMEAAPEKRRWGGGLGMVWEVKAVHVNHTGLGRGKVGGGDGPEQAPVIKKKATEGTSLDGGR